MRVVIHHGSGGHRTEFDASYQDAILIQVDGQDVVGLDFQYTADGLANDTVDPWPHAPGEPHFNIGFWPDGPEGEAGWVTAAHVPQLPETDGQP